MYLRLGSKKDFTKDKIPRCQHVSLTILLSLGEEVIRANTLKRGFHSSAMYTGRYRKSWAIRRTAGFHVIAIVTIMEVFLDLSCAVSAAETKPSISVCRARH